MQFCASTHDPPIVGNYSLCSAWMEKYKVAQKKTVQKSKSLRKELVKE